MNSFNFLILLFAFVGLVGKDWHKLSDDFITLIDCHSLDYSLLIEFSEPLDRCEHLINNETSDNENVSSKVDCNDSCN